MSKKEAELLHSGDRVTWNDPECDLSTRTLVIKSVRWAWPCKMLITDKDGKRLDCYFWELSASGNFPSAAEYGDDGYEIQPSSTRALAAQSKYDYAQLTQEAA